MNLLAALSVFIFIIYVSMGLYAFKTLVQSAERFWFLVLCVQLSTWSLGYLFVYQETINNEFWMKLSAFGWCLVSATLLNIALEITQNKLFTKSMYKGALYLPGVVLLYMRVCFSWPLVYSDITFYKIYVMLDLLYNMSYQGIALLLVFVWGFKFSNVRERKQAKIIIGACSVSFALNFLTNVKVLPPIGQIYSLAMMLGIYYAMEKSLI